MGVVVRISNAAWGGRVEVEEESLQVDYVHVFWSRETFQNISMEMDRLISLAGEMITMSEQTGAGDLGKVIECYEDAKYNWEEQFYYVASTLDAVLVLCQTWEDFKPRFAYAETLVNGLNDSDPHTGIVERKFNDAKQEWDAALRVFPSKTSAFCKNAADMLLDIEAFGEICEDGCFDQAEEHVAGIEDERTKLVMDSKLNQARNAWEGGEYSLANNYLKQIIDHSESRISSG
jgi:hypothetical protein